MRRNWNDISSDRRVDMGRTTVNITGDIVCSVIIDRIEREQKMQKKKFKER